MKTIVSILLCFAINITANPYLGIAGSSVAAVGGGGGSGVPTFTASVVGTAVQTTTLTLTLPTHQANDILIAIVTDGSGQTITCNTAGWAEIATQVTDSANVTVSFWWKRAAGASETNPEFAVGSTPDVFFGATSGFRACVATGTPFEDATTVAVSSTTTPQSASITTTGVDRLVVAMMGQDNNLTPWNNHPTTGWSNAYPTADTSTSVGADARIGCQYIAQATADTVAAVTIGTLNIAEESGQITFALIPD